MMKSIASHYLPSTKAQQRRFFEALYEFINNEIPSLSAQKNVDKIISDYDQIIKNEASDFYFSATESHIDYINTIDKRKKNLDFLSENFELYEGLLRKLLEDNPYRRTVKNELEEFLFGPPHFYSKIIEIGLKFLANIRGWCKTRLSY